MCESTSEWRSDYTAVETYHISFSSACTVEIQVQFILNLHCAPAVPAHQRAASLCNTLFHQTSTQLQLTLQLFTEFHWKKMQI